MMILIDMDGVISDFESGFLIRWKKSYPNREYFSASNRMSFYIKSDYPSKYLKDIENIYNSAGFLSNLLPIKGSIEAVRELNKNHKVFICSSTLAKNKYSLMEKQSWIDRYFGNEWINKLIIASDKTLINGDVLIDDKPIIVGAKKPCWEHIIFDQPYNKSVENKKRINWQNWKKILKIQSLSSSI